MHFHVFDIIILQKNINMEIKNTWARYGLHWKKVKVSGN